MNTLDDVADGRSLALDNIEYRAVPVRTSEHFPLVREFLTQFVGPHYRSFLGRMFGHSPIPRSSRRLYRGAVGEVTVSDALAQLGSGWIVLDSVPVGVAGGTVNHVVIGPGGVLTIAVRNHGGSAIWVGGSVVLVDGERVPYTRDAEFEAVRTSQLLSDAAGWRIEVTPCLVVVDPRSLTVTRPPRRLAILTPRELRTWLRSLPRVFSPEQLAALVTAGLSWETWGDGPTIPDDSAEVLSRFRRIHADVNQARRLRLAWVIGGLVLLWLVAIIGVGGFATGIFFH